MAVSLPCLAVVAEDFEGQEGELTLSEGSKVIVTVVDDDGWWTIQTKKEKGIFPGSYLDILEHIRLPCRAKVTQPFKPMNLQVGTVVQVNTITEDGWEISWGPKKGVSSWLYLDFTDQPLTPYSEPGAAPAPAPAAAAAPAVPARKPSSPALPAPGISSLKPSGPASPRNAAPLSPRGGAGAAPPLSPRSGAGSVPPPAAPRSTSPPAAAPRSTSPSAASASPRAAAPPPPTAATKPVASYSSSSSSSSSPSPGMTVASTVSRNSRVAAGPTNVSSNLSLRGARQSMIVGSLFTGQEAADQMEEIARQRQAGYNPYLLPSQQKMAQQFEQEGRWEFHKHIDLPPPPPYTDVEKVYFTGPFASYIDFEAKIRSAVFDI